MRRWRAWRVAWCRLSHVRANDACDACQTVVTTRRYDRVTVTDDTLPLILHASPAIERALRATLVAALDARRYRDAPLDARAFANATLRALADDATFAALDAVARHDLDALALRVALRFASSKLARRLFAVTLERIVPAPEGCDAAVRDDSGTLHLVRVETFASDQERLTAVRATFRDATTAARPLADAGARPIVHCFSLRDGRLRTYGRRVARVALRAVPSRAA